MKYSYKCSYLNYVTDVYGFIIFTQVFRKLTVRLGISTHYWIFISVTICFGFGPTARDQGACRESGPIRRPSLQLTRVNELFKSGAQTGREVHPCGTRPELRANRPTVWAVSTRRTTQSIIICSRSSNCNPHSTTSHISDTPTCCPRVLFRSSGDWWSVTPPSMTLTNWQWSLTCYDAINHRWRVH